MKNKTVIVIPTKYSSSRYKEKLLDKILEKELIFRIADISKKITGSAIEVAKKINTKIYINVQNDERPIYTKDIKVKNFLIMSYVDMIKLINFKITSVKI